ncbi:MAG TPA: hypothetical protein VGQ45_09640 [Gaiellales bacterium]|nr:hypothetical protein [Gaiellales bacterium]
MGLTRAYPAEHEAFLTLLARDAGVPAVEVVMAGIPTFPCRAASASSREGWQ